MGSQFLRLLLCALAISICAINLSAQQRLKPLSDRNPIVFGKPPRPASDVRQVAWAPQFPMRDDLEELIPNIGAEVNAEDFAMQPVSQPGAGRTEFLPLPKGDANAKIELAGTKDSVSLSAIGAELSAVLKLIADEHHMNLVLGPKVKGPVTVSISDANLDEILDAILAVGGFTWHQNGSLLYVTSLNSEGTLDPRVQGKQVQVFPLNYVAAVEAERIVVGLLSAAGQVFVSESSATDQKRTQELLVVEDVPSAIHRIQNYLAQIDQPPRQVLIEAHVMQVTLDDELRHGVNLASLAKAAGAEIEFKTSGFANADASPGATLGINGSDLDAVVELIRTYSNARTLASPKVLAVNRQKARIQIGSQLGYYVTTTTQTGTFQSVEFLDTGVVLTVEPIISDTGDILMTVTPEVSGGRINALGLPEEETTEVTSTILLPDGGGVVIGGLIKETDQDDHAMVPILGRIPKIGKFFSRHGRDARREEIIIALVTHIVPNVEEVRAHEMEELHRGIAPHAAASLRRPGVSSEIMMPSQFERRLPVLEATR